MDSITRCHDGGPRLGGLLSKLSCADPVDRESRLLETAGLVWFCKSRLSYRSTRRQSSADKAEACLWRREWVVSADEDCGRRGSPKWACVRKRGTARAARTGGRRASGGGGVRRRG